MEQGRREDGFTVLELMTVALIISIIIATAMPAFARTRQRAQERATQSSLVDGAKAVLIVGLDSGVFPSTATLLDDLPAVESAYSWLDSTVASAASNEISVRQSGSGSEVEIAAISESGTCYYMRVVLNGVTEYHLSDADPCTSDWFETAAATGWD